MENVFLKLLNMSITASWLVLAVVVLRLLLKKAPKWLNTVLWAFVGFRLVCPFSFESVLSLIPSTETIPNSVIQGPSFDVNTGINFVDNTVNDYLGSHYFEGVTVPADTGMTTISILSIIWFIGIVAMILYAVISFVRLNKKVREGVVIKDNIWLCDRIDTPFILGLWGPRIFLPSSMNESDMEYVIAHEKAHLKRNDHWWKPLGFLLLAVYWFNPVMWLAYILLCRDIELACDEKVIKEMGAEIKKSYSEALINCSVPRKSIAACPLAFGETGVKGRIKSVLSYKKPALWVIIIAVISCIAVAVCFLTNPKSELKENKPDSSTSFSDYKKAADIIRGEADITAMHYPVTENDEASILVGKAYGSDVADYLDNVKWKKSTDPLDSLSSPGSVEFVIDENYRITVYERKKGSVFAYAVVKVNGEERYYHASYDDYEKAVAILHTPESITATSPVKWTYSPWLSATFHSFFYIDFDFDYTHIITTCKNGQMQNLDAEGQPKDTSLRFEKGEHVCWTPDETANGKVHDTAEVNFTVYNGEEQIYYGNLLFDCVEKKSGSATYNIYLQNSNGLILLQKNTGACLVEAENMASGSGVDEPGNYSDLPELVVVHENEGIFAWTGTATWTFTMNNGTAQTINADGHHALDRIDEISKHWAINIDDRAESSSVVKLNFDIVPDSIKVNSWLITEKGNIKAFSAEVNGLNIIHKNKNETYLYEVVAEWNSSDKYSGKIHYAFCVKSEQLDISLLREKYPQFFDLSTDGGLTVYIWQMAEYNYSCYLMNSSMDALTDMSFAFTEGTTISEMRAILSTYDIDRNDITVRPCSNPISSYAYIIDDAYKKKLEEKFWS